MSSRSAARAMTSARVRPLWSAARKWLPMAVQKAIRLTRTYTGPRPFWRIRFPPRVDLSLTSTVVGNRV
ncbi:hypothetical protein [Actinosynnema sp. ALI-1.44]|uniref:hypothetical protein n=1 Tax=Actinosynnema sp. ALI-1.44 TaxID=1933779 RepID=UPI001875059D|nr:hypothetical protein [Actinosynnema sp. ALI-1.44]